MSLVAVGAVSSHNEITCDLHRGESEEAIDDGSVVVTVTDASLQPIPGRTWPADMVRDPNEPGRYRVTLAPSLFPQPAGLYAHVTALGAGLQVAVKMPFVTMSNDGLATDYARALEFAISEGVVEGDGYCS